MNTQDAQLAIGPPTKRVREQVRTFGPAPISGRYGAGAMITATVRFDDRCGNGCNTFSITADVTTPESRAQRDIVAGGCLHVDIVTVFPDLAPLIKWHLCSTDGPLHYVENTMFWLGRRGYTRWDNERAGRKFTRNDPPNFEHAKKSAVWLDMPEGFVLTGTSVSNAIVEEALADRLPALLAEFRAAIESLGMVW
jgi:hypothetical protein